MAASRQRWMFYLLHFLTRLPAGLTKTVEHTVSSEDLGMKQDRRQEGGKARHDGSFAG
jgi:hypothetical protein